MTTHDVVQGVRITHPDRIVYADAGLTKLDVALYYEQVADWIVPHLRGRPLTLVRCPEGMRGECFYMKHSNVWAPAPLTRVRIQEKKKLGEYLIANDGGGVLYAGEAERAGQRDARVAGAETIARSRVVHGQHGAATTCPGAQGSVGRLLDDAAAIDEADVESGTS